MARTPQIGDPELTPQARSMTAFSPPSATGEMFGAGRRDFVGPALATGLSEVGTSLHKAVQAYQHDQDSLQRFNTQASFLDFTGQEDQRLQTEATEKMPLGGKDFTRNYVSGNPEADGEQDTFDARSKQWIETHTPEGSELRAQFEAKLQGLRNTVSAHALAKELTTRESYTNSTITDAMARAKSTFADTPTPEQLTAASKQVDDLIESSGLTPGAKEAYRKQWARDSEMAFNMSREQRFPGSVVEGHQDKARKTVGETRVFDPANLEGYLDKTKGIENPSSNPAAVSPTGARGDFQFIKSTWDQFGKGDINNPADNRAAAGRLAVANASTLQSVLGRPPTEAEVYLAHQQGAQGAAALLSHPGENAVVALNRYAGLTMQEAERNLRVNGGDSRMTAGAFAAKWTKRFDGSTPQGAVDAASRTAHLSIRADAPTSNLTFEDKMRLLDFSQRNFDKTMADVNAAQVAAHTDWVSNFEKAAHDGAAGRADLEAAWKDGKFRDFNEYAAVENRIIMREKKTADATAFGTRMADPNQQWNPFSADDRKVVNAGHEALGATPESGFEIFKRTGILPEATTAFMRGALVSQDPQRVETAATIAGNMLSRNPNALAGLPSGDDIEKAGITFNHYVNDLGMSSKDAAQRLTERNTPEWKSRVGVRDEQAKAFKDTLMKDTPASAIADAMDPGIFSRAPSVNAMPPEQRGEMLQTYAELATDYFTHNGADPAEAKAYASKKMQQLYGLSNGVLMKYPPEKGYPKDAEGGQGYIYEQAAKDLKTITGADVAARDIYLTPIPRATAEAFKAGQPAPYLLHYREMIDGIPIWKSVPGRGFTADVAAANAAITERRKAEFERSRSYALRVGAGEVPVEVSGSPGEPASLGAR